jgi:hypothetical protein
MMMRSGPKPKYFSGRLITYTVYNDATNSGNARTTLTHSLTLRTCTVVTTVCSSACIALHCIHAIW